MKQVNYYQATSCIHGEQKPKILENLFPLLSRNVGTMMSEQVSEMLDFCYELLHLVTQEYFITFGKYFRNFIQLQTEVWGSALKI